MGALVVTPPEITPQILEFCRNELGCGGAPFFIEITAARRAKPGECHYNVDHAIQVQGGRQVFGWAIWQGHSWIEAEFHGIHETANGELVDLTPDADGETRRLFVVDTKHTFQGRAIPKHYKVLTPSVAVAKGIEKFAAANKIRCQYVAGRRMPMSVALEIHLLEAAGGTLLQEGVRRKFKPTEKERRLARQLKRRAKRDARKSKGGAL